MRSRDPGEAGEIGRDRPRETDGVIKTRRETETGRKGGKETKRYQETDRKKRNRDREGVRAPSQAVTEQAQPEGGVSLECSQLGESQAALEIGGREGRSRGK